MNTFLLACLMTCLKEAALPKNGDCPLPFPSHCDCYFKFAHPVGTVPFFGKACKGPFLPFKCKRTLPDHRHGLITAINHCDRLPILPKSFVGGERVV